VVGLLFLHDYVVHTRYKSQAQCSFEFATEKNQPYRLCDIEVATKNIETIQPYRLRDMKATTKNIADRIGTFLHLSRVTDKNLSNLTYRDGEKSSAREQSFR
jgi:hypothetical protein